MGLLHKSEKDGKYPTLSLPGNFTPPFLNFVPLCLGVFVLNSLEKWALERSASASASASKRIEKSERWQLPIPFPNSSPITLHSLRVGVGVGVGRRYRKLRELPIPFPNSSLITLHFLPLRTLRLCERIPFPCYFFNLTRLFSALCALVPLC